MIANEMIIDAKLLLYCSIHFGYQLEFGKSLCMYDIFGILVIKEPTLTQGHTFIHPHEPKCA
jgi:hypothetical protein